MNWIFQPLYIGFENLKQYYTSKLRRNGLVKIIGYSVVCNVCSFTMFTPDRVLIKIRVHVCSDFNYWSQLLGLQTRPSADADSVSV